MTEGMIRDPLIGTEFGSFHILGRIAAGGMAVVYRAHDKSRDHDVALKVLHETYVSDDEVVARFKQEAHLAQQLQHPNLVPVLETGEAAGRLYIAMELIRGGNLTTYIERHPLMPLSRSARILAQIADALDYAHSRNVIHRDIKLGNVLINASGNALLSDFGIARWLDVSNLTATGNQMPGTARYMSPEQVIGKMNLDYRTDLYSFGVIGYLLAVGRFPFTGVSDFVLMNQHLNMQPPDPTMINPLVPPALDGVLIKALSKVPSRRYDSATEFAEAFKTAIVENEDVRILMQPDAENPASVPTDESEAPTPIISAPIKAPVKDDESALSVRPNRGMTASALMTFIIVIIITGIAIVLISSGQLPLFVASSNITPSATSTQTETQTTTATETATPTATPTETGTATPSATPTATHTVTNTQTDTRTPTHTPTASPSATPTITPTPRFPTLEAAFDVLKDSRPLAFDCAAFNAVYAHLIETPAAAELVNDPADPISRIESEFCRAQPDETETQIESRLYFEMLAALDEFE